MLLQILKTIIMILITLKYFIAHLEGNGKYLYDKCIKIIEETRIELIILVVIFLVKTKNSVIFATIIFHKKLHQSTIINKYSTELKKYRCYYIYDINKNNDKSVKYIKKTIRCELYR
jgi:hypothetical protein